MAAYTVVNSDIGGTRLDNAYAAVAASDTFVNDGNTRLHVKNANASTCNVTFDLAVDPNVGDPTQDASTPTDLPMLTTEEHIFGPFPTGRYGTLVTVNYSLTPSVTAVAVRG